MYERGRGEKGEEDSGAVWGARRGEGITEATKKGRKGKRSRGRKRVAAAGGGGRYFRKLRRSAARRPARLRETAREHKKQKPAGMLHFRVSPKRFETITIDRSKLRGRSSNDRRHAGSRARERGTRLFRAGRKIGTRRENTTTANTGVGLPTSRHSPVPWTVLYLPLSMTLYTGPFRLLSVRRNTVFYQLLRRAPITGKL